MKNVSHEWRFYFLFWGRWDILKKTHNFWISGLAKISFGMLLNFLKDVQLCGADSSITNGWVLLAFSWQEKNETDFSVLGDLEYINLLSEKFVWCWFYTYLLFYCFQYLILTQKHGKCIISSLKWNPLDSWKPRRNPYENLRIFFTTLIFFLSSFFTSKTENNNFALLRGSNNKNHRIIE